MGRLALVLVFAFFGCSETAGTGGSAGSDGTGGVGGVGGQPGGGGSGGSGGTGGEGSTVSCVPSEFACSNREIDPIEEMCEIIVPDQARACDGTESIDNPANCAASGSSVTHKLTKMQIVANCNVGYNLDGCDGNSCAVGNRLTPGDGANGVDNGLGHATIFDDREIHFGILDQAFHNAICTGGIDIEIEVDAVPDDRCAVVTLLSAGAPGDPTPMNLSDDGCLSGTVGTIPIALGGVQGTLRNAVVRMTVSSMGFSDGTLGGTAGLSTAGAMVEEILDGFSQVLPQLLDINADLSGNSAEACDSLSMTLEIGGYALLPGSAAKEGGR